MRSELLPDRHEWWRIADAGWKDPLEPSFAAERGGRWNPPRSFPTLYFNENLVTARLNLRLFIAGWPYEPEELRDDTGPILVGATLPRNQRVADAHSVKGIARLGLPASYPLDGEGKLVSRELSQVIGARVNKRGWRGIRCRSARAQDGAGRELAWFPAVPRSRAKLTTRLDFESWFWG